MFKTDRFIKNKNRALSVIGVCGGGRVCYIESMFKEVFRVFLVHRS